MQSACLSSASVSPPTHPPPPPPFPHLPHSSFLVSTDSASLETAAGLLGQVQANPSHLLVSVRSVSPTASQARRSRTGITATQVTAATLAVESATATTAQQVIVASQPEERIKQEETAPFQENMQEMTAAAPHIRTHTTTTAAVLTATPNSRSRSRSRSRSPLSRPRAIHVLPPVDTIQETIPPSNIKRKPSITTTTTTTTTNPAGQTNTANATHHGTMSFDAPAVRRGSGVFFFEKRMEQQQQQHASNRRSSGMFEEKEEIIIGEGRKRQFTVTSSAATNSNKSYLLSVKKGVAGFRYISHMPRNLLICEGLAVSDFSTTNQAQNNLNPLLKSRALFNEYFDLFGPMTLPERQASNSANKHIQTNVSPFNSDGVASMGQRLLPGEQQQQHDNQAATTTTDINRKTVNYRACNSREIAVHGQRRLRNLMRMDFGVNMNDTIASDVDPLLEAEQFISDYEKLVCEFPLAVAGAGAGAGASASAADELGKGSSELKSIFSLSNLNDAMKEVRGNLKLRLSEDSLQLISHQFFTFLTSNYKLLKQSEDLLNSASQQSQQQHGNSRLQQQQSNSRRDESCASPAVEVAVDDRQSSDYSADSNLHVKQSQQAQKQQQQYAYPAISSMIITSMHNGLTFLPPTAAAATSLTYIEEFCSVKSMQSQLSLNEDTAMQSQQQVQTKPKNRARRASSKTVLQESPLNQNAFSSSRLLLRKLSLQQTSQGASQDFDNLLAAADDDDENDDGEDENNDQPFENNPANLHHHHHDQQQQQQQQQQHLLHVQQTKPEKKKRTNNFYNLPRYFMMLILTLLSPANLASMGVECTLRVQIARIVANMREQGRKKQGTKSNFYNHNHYNCLFLQEVFIWQDPFVQRGGNPALPQISDSQNLPGIQAELFGQQRRRQSSQNQSTSSSSNSHINNNNNTMMAISNMSQANNNSINCTASSSIKKSKKKNEKSSSTRMRAASGSNAAGCVSEFTPIGGGSGCVVVASAAGSEKRNEELKMRDKVFFELLNASDQEAIERGTGISWYGMASMNALKAVITEVVVKQLEEILNLPLTQFVLQHAHSYPFEKSKINYITRVIAGIHKLAAAEPLNRF